MHNLPILILAYHYPPENSGGVGRPSSLYKHLEKFGLEPHVITVEHNDAPPGELNIYRFSSLARGKHEGVFNQKLFYRIINKLLKYFGADPSIDIYWSYKVKAGIGSIINNNDIKAIYASFPPIQSMKLGMYIRKNYKIPLFSEFRDGYLFASIYNYTQLQKYFNDGLERKIINSSSAIVTIGKNLTNYFLDNYKGIEVFTVYNGFEKSDYSLDGHAGISKPISNPAYKFVHFGSLNLSKKRNVRPLFLALSRLKKDGLISNVNFNITFIGKHAYEEYNYVDIFNIEDIVKFKEPVDKINGFVDIMNNYDNLLFYGVENDPTFISAKLLEYIKLGKPILGICEGNEAEDIIRMTKTGIICGFNEKEIYNAFLKFLNNEILYHPDLEVINQFDREHQAKEIAVIIHKFIKTPGYDNSLG